MLVLVIVFVFFVLHIEFLIEVIFFGRTEFIYFGWEFTYPYPKETAISALIFSILCLTCFLVGYFSIKKRIDIPNLRDFYSPYGKDSEIFGLTIFFLLFQIICNLYVIIAGGFVYWKMNDVRASLSFFFEMRMIPTLLFSYILLNSKPSDWKKKEFKRLGFFLLLYGITLFLTQARSLAFEFIVVFVFYWLRINNNKFKIKYILYLYLASLIPNVIVLFRLGESQTDFSNPENIKSFFTYEYSLLFNNILSEVITHKDNLLLGETISIGFKLLVPSFLRDLLGIVVDKSIVINTAEEAGVRGGGFSLLGELFMNFGYSSCLFFLLGGCIISYFNNRVFYRKYVLFRFAAAPLLYSYFLLAFRNDLGVFIKQILQLFLVVLFFSALMKISGRQTNNKDKIDGHNI